VSVLLRDVLEIPERAGAEDYVLRLTDSVEQAAVAARWMSTSSPRRGPRWSCSHRPAFAAAAGGGRTLGVHLLDLFGSATGDSFDVDTSDVDVLVEFTTPHGLTTLMPILD
jgi:hypothetical protein